MVILLLPYVNILKKNHKTEFCNILVYYGCNLELKTLDGITLAIRLLPVCILFCLMVFSEVAQQEILPCLARPLCILFTAVRC